jgi:hypothetical protein
MEQHIHLRRRLRQVKQPFRERFVEAVILLSGSAPPILASPASAIPIHLSAKSVSPRVVFCGEHSKFPTILGNYKHRLHSGNESRPKFRESIGASPQRSISGKIDQDLRHQTSYLQ